MSDQDCPPLPPLRVRHRGALVNAKGGVSALCFKTQRAIDMKRASWTLIDSGVTCAKCRSAIARKAAA